MNDGKRDPNQVGPMSGGKSSATKQYGTSALFWVTFIIGLGIAYLERQDSPEVVTGGLFGVAIGAGVGAMLGLLTRKWSDALFWATLVAAFGYIATAGDPAVDTVYRLKWATVGAFAGGIAAVSFSKNFPLNVAVCAAVAGLVMAAFCFVGQNRSSDMIFDLYTAPVIGVAVAFFVRILLWLESQRKMPRYITATWLLVVVIIGSSISR